MNLGILLAFSACLALISSLDFEKLEKLKTKEVYMKCMDELCADAKKMEETFKCTTRLPDKFMGMMMKSAKECYGLEDLNPKEAGKKCCENLDVAYNCSSKMNKDFDEIKSECTEEDVEALGKYIKCLDPYFEKCTA